MASSVFLQFAQAGGTAAFGGNISAVGDVSAGGKFLASDGTAALPSHSFTSAPTNGLYNASSSAIGLSTQGVLRGYFDSTGFVSLTGVKITQTTVALLPTPVGAEGTYRGVTDALTPVSLAIVAGGGAVHVPVYSNGTNWIVA